MESAGKWLLYLAVAAVIGGMIVFLVSVAQTMWKRLSGQGETEPSPPMPPMEKFLFYGLFKTLVAVLAAIPTTVLMGMVFSHIHSGKDLLDDFLGVVDFLVYAIYLIIPVIFAYFYIYMGKGWRQAIPVASVLMAVTVIYWFIAFAFGPRQDSYVFIVLFLIPYVAGPPLAVRWLHRRPPFAVSGPAEPA